MSSDQFQRVEKLTGECELVRYIGQKDNPAFQNSWVNYGTTSLAGFYKDKFNRVWLTGWIKNGTVGAFAAFTLPSGYRPTDINKHSGIDGAGTPSAQIQIQTNGDVQIVAGNNTLISMDGVSWRV